MQTPPVVPSMVIDALINGNADSGAMTWGAGPVKLKRIVEVMPGGIPFASWIA